MSNQRQTQWQALTLMAPYNDPAYVSDYLECWAPHLSILTARVADAVSAKVDDKSTVVDLGAGTGAVIRAGVRVHGVKRLPSSATRPG